MGFAGPTIASPDAQLTYTAKVLREGTRQVSNRYVLDPLAGRWRELAVAHGILAIAWIPLRRTGEVYGALMLCAEAEDFFDAELLSVLDELGGDISFALDNIDRAAERQAALREIEAGRDRFQRLFQAAPVASAILALADRRIVDVNESTCRRYGMSREAIIGTIPAAHAHGIVPEDRELFYRTLQEEGRVRNLVVRVRDSQGAVHPEVMNAEPISYLGQACCLVTSLDLGDLQVTTATRKALAEAQASNRAKNEFLSRISHELRTPLHAILGFAAVLKRDAATRMGSDGIAQVHHIEQAGKHLLALVNDVLDLSRIEAGQLNLRCMPTELEPLLKESIDLTRPLAAGAGVRVHLDAAAFPSVNAMQAVMTDRTRLGQVLINLLSNAIKYNRPGGDVWIRPARRDNKLWHLDVVDNGIGMSKEQQSRLFEPFNRLGREKGDIEGTGIGLSLARQLVALMGGEMTIDSEPSLGTTVRLTLPACDLPLDAHEIGEPARSSSMLIEGAPEPLDASLLCIEDNPVNALLVTELLRPWPGLRIVVAPNASKALQQFEDLRPTLVLLDMQLPDLDGIEVLRRLRARGDPMVMPPIIVLSASAMPEDVAAARAAGATDYWTKPLDFERFPKDVLQHVRKATVRS
ncbi:MAG: response regulator [Paucibacter sp.]|nr:response regulator [Roseateles sp.]